MGRQRGRGSFRSWRHILLGVAVAGILVVGNAPGRSREARAASSCTNGEMMTSTVYGYNFGGSSVESPQMPFVLDTKKHRFTRVTFKTWGARDAVCTWTPPVTVKGHAFVVGGGGAGGTNWGGGGGGGGVAWGKNINFSNGKTYSITVGVGGEPVQGTCVTSCTGGDGHGSSISIAGVASSKLIGASGGAGGGGGGTAGRFMPCADGDACGGGSGAGAPQVVSWDVTNAGGSGNSSNASWLSVVGSSGAGESAKYFAYSTGKPVTGGGGGAGLSRAVSRNGSFGGSGVPLPLLGEASLATHYVYGSGGGGVWVNSDETFIGAGSLKYGSFDTGAQYSTGGRGSAGVDSWATAGLADHGGGGGGGAGMPGTWSTTSYGAAYGGAGGSGSVSIFYLELPQISGPDTVTTVYGNAASATYVTSGGNADTRVDTTESTTVSYLYAMWGTDRPLPGGITLNGRGVLGVSASVPAGTYRATIAAVDGMASMSTKTVTITVNRSSQANVGFTSTAPVDHHPGGDFYWANIFGGSGTGAYQITVDPAASSVCSASSMMGNMSAVSFLAAGTCTLRGKRVGDGNFLDSDTAVQTILVTPPAAQSPLSFANSFRDHVNVGETVDIVPSGGNGTGSYAVTVADFASSVCAISGRTVTALANGFCVVNLDRPGDYEFADATRVSTQFQVVSGRTITLSQPTQKVWEWNGTDLVATVGASVSAGAPISVWFVATADSTNCGFTGMSRYDLVITGTGLCKVYVEENDNTYAYTRSPDYTFYVIAPGDVTAPTVSNVRAPGFDGVFESGKQIDVAVRFSERVKVTGSPRIQLETGATDRWADYVSGSYSDTLVFRYTVQPSDYTPSLEYVDTNALDPNGGTITDLAGNNATLTLPARGAAESLSVGASISVGTTTTTTTTTTTSTTTTTTEAPTTTAVATLEPPDLVVSSEFAAGYRFLIRNYNPDCTYTFASPAGTAISWAIQDLGMVRVTGLAAGETIEVGVTVDNGSATATSTVEGTALRTAVNPEFGAVSSTELGFKVPITNFDDNWSYIVTAGSGYVENGELIATTIEGGSTASVTVETQRSGYEAGIGTVSGRALAASTTTTSTAVPVTTDGGSVSAGAAVPTTVVDAPRFTLRRGKSASIRVIARRFGLQVPKGATLRASVHSASRTRCSVTASSVKGLRKGSCRLKLAVSRAGRRDVRRTVNVSIG